MARSDRPLSRSIIKLATRVLLGKSRAHVQDWFPGLRIKKAAAGNAGAVFYYGQQIAALSPSEALSHRSGAAVYVIGSGPSIGSSDLKKVPPRSALLLNGAISLVRTKVDQPLAVAVEDERFIFRHLDMLQQVPKDVPCLLSVSAIRSICECDRGFLRERNIILIDNILRPYGASRRSLAAADRLGDVLVDLERGAGISLNPDHGVFQAGSVAVSTLQFALYCKPKLIGFLGIDISNAATQPRFYEDHGKSAFSGVARAEEIILHHFELAKDIAMERGIALMNHSATSALSKIGLDYDARFALAPS